MRISALTVLMMFCALLFLQTACTAGVLSHCEHQEHQDHTTSHPKDLTPCDFDRCGDNYSVPGKINTIKIVSHFPVTLAAFDEISATCGANSPAPYSQPLVFTSPRPAGNFPLLI